MSFEASQVPDTPPSTPTPIPVLEDRRHMTTGGNKRRRVSAVNLMNIMEEHHEEIMEKLQDIETLCRKDFLERLRKD